MFFPVSKVKYNNCVCDGNITVRMWTTAQKDKGVLNANAKSGGCIFSVKSGWRQPLGLITSGKWGNESEPSLIEGIPAAALPATTASYPVTTETCVILPSRTRENTSADTLPNSARVDAVDENSVHEDNVVGRQSMSQTTSGTNKSPDGSEGSLSISLLVNSAPENDQQTMEGYCNHARGTGATAALSSSHNRLEEVTLEILLLRSHQSDEVGEGFCSEENSNLDSMELLTTTRRRLHPLPTHLSLPPVCKNFFRFETTIQWLNSLFFQ